MSKEAKDRIQSQTERVLILSDQSFENFIRTWRPAGDQTNLLGSAYFFKLGSLIVVPDMRKETDKLLETNKELAYALKDLDKDFAYDLVRCSMLINSYTHELVHASQDMLTTSDSNSTKQRICRAALSECGASFITATFLREKYPRVLPSETAVDPKRSEIFAELGVRYGENVFNVFFGNVPEDEEQRHRYHQLQEKIYSEFTAKNLKEIGILTEKQAEILDFLDLLQPI